jgi:hypothetical protein
MMLTLPTAALRVSICYISPAARQVFLLSFGSLSTHHAGERML